MKTIFITGAGKGIGRSTVKRLSARGYRIYAGVRKSGDAPTGENITEIILDVTQTDQIVAARRTIEAAVDGLDGLVNNAGIAVAAPLEHVAIEEFRRQIEVNLTGQLAVTQALLPMLKAARGRIVMMSSVGGRIAGGILGPYHASKFALEAVSDTLRVELRPWGVKTILIEPGAIATPIWDTSRALMDSYTSGADSPMIADYRLPIEKTHRSAQASSRNGLPPERVAKAVEKALTARRPRARYIVGLDSWLGIKVFAPIPPIIRDPIVATRIW